MIELSLLVLAAILNSSNSPKNLGGLILPITMSSSFRTASGYTMPSSSQDIASGLVSEALPWISDDISVIVVQVK